MSQNRIEKILTNYRFGVFWKLKRLANKKYRNRLLHWIPDQWAMQKADKATERLEMKIRISYLV